MRSETCHWVQCNEGGSYWEPDCCSGFTLEGAPSDSPFKYKDCPYCGGEIEEVPWVADESDEGGE